ncbi:hypothetical protein [Kamptonema formosum]|uniref:hypothetical protein n=1 Tax=Kamptonema formosum TaxID=331992 RepID=UPI0012DE1370|nr:hypothetical protein [Oscillatoria sp. PCC 10802]
MPVLRLYRGDADPDVAQASRLCPPVMDRGDAGPTPFWGRCRWDGQARRLSYAFIGETLIQT